MLMTSWTNVFEVQAKLFRGLSDESRLAILETLRSGPQPVARIVKATGLSQSNTSNHLRCLSDCGLVAAEHQGRFVYYRLSDERINGLLGLADQLLAEIGRRIFACTNVTSPARAKSASSARPRKQRSL